MGGFRRGSLVRRAAIGVFALYALLLQGFLSVSAPAAAFPFPGGSDVYNCSEDGTGSGIPGEHSSQNHSLCCILACAAAACAYVGTAASAAVFPAIGEVLRIAFAPLPGIAARPPLKFFFAARGPPQNL